jgi:hypothetical protein
MCFFCAGLEIRWEKEFGMRLYISLDPIWQGKVVGLCGDYDGQAKNDLRGKDGQLETNPIAFGNEWRTDSKCPKTTETPIHPCSVNKQRKYWAEMGCAKLQSDMFAECHSVVSVGLLEIYYRIRMDPIQILSLLSKNIRM